MTLIDTIVWAIVELQAAQPNIPEVKAVLEKALQEAAVSEFAKENLKRNLLRVAEVAGVDNSLNGTTRIRP